METTEKTIPGKYGNSTWSVTWCISIHQCIFFVPTLQQRLRSWKLGRFQINPIEALFFLMFLPPIEGLSATYSLAQYLDITTYPT